MIPYRFCEDCHGWIRGIIHARPHYRIESHHIEAYLQNGAIVDRYCMDCSRRKDFVCKHPQDPEPPCLNILLHLR